MGYLAAHARSAFFASSMAVLAVGSGVALSSCARGVAVQGSGGGSTSGATTAASGSPSSTGASSTGMSSTGVSSAGLSSTGVSSTGTGGGCTSNGQCPTGKACIGGVCGSCTANTNCDPGQACVVGSCGACQLSSQCTAGEVCTFGQCRQGTLVQMYQCPGVTSLGGGSWGFYGCQNQIANTPTCNEIESPTTQNFPCTPVGKLAIVTGTGSPPSGTSFVNMYQCPGVTSLGGGSWGFYGCQNQITNTPTCNEIESPTTKNFPCSPVGSMALEP